MPALIVLLLLTLPLSALAAPPAQREGATDADLRVQAAAIDLDDEDQADPVILKTQARQPARQPGRQPAQRPARGAKPVKKNDNTFLRLFWTLFQPPGDYQLELSLMGGMKYLETAHTNSQPNWIGRVQGNYRVSPDLPIQVFGALDYSQYTQSAGPLQYASRYMTLAAGGGLVHWISALRLDLGAELGLTMRMASQTDGKGTDLTNYAAQPVAGIIGGMGYSLFGHVGLSVRGAVRTRTNRGFDFAAFDYMVLYGLEWMIDAKPKPVY